LINNTFVSPDGNFTRDAVSTAGHTYNTATNVFFGNRLIAGNSDFSATYNLADESANLVAVYVNNTLGYANANINFNNTSTINVTVIANTTNKRANVEFSANGAGAFSLNTLTVNSMNVNGILNVTSNTAITGLMSVLSGQIRFPATANGSSNVNTLDDYEEGTWDPEIKGTSGGAYTMGGINAGTYTKIGRQVTVHASIEWTARTTPYSGLFAVYGLPFANIGGRCSGVLAAVNNGLRFSSNTYSEWNVIIDPNNSYAYIIENGADGDGYSHSPTVDSTGQIYGFTLTYQAAT
jgi:hypothetical protein